MFGEINSLIKSSAPFSSVLRDRVWLIPFGVFYLRNVSSVRAEFLSVLLQKTVVGQLSNQKLNPENASHPIEKFVSVSLVVIS